MPRVLSAPAPVLTEIEDVTEQGALEALRAEWGGLWQRCPSATPFQSPEWLLAWWKHLGSGRPWVIVLRQEGRVAGILPLFVAGSPRTAAFLGTGISDHLDMLVEPGMGKTAATLFFEHLYRQRHRWGACHLCDIPQGSPLLKVPAGLGLWIVRAPSTPCPVLDLPSTREELFSGLSAARRRNLERGIKALARNGEILLEMADAGNISECVEALFLLHATRWRKKGLPGVLQDDAVRAFHKDAARGLLENGSLRFHALKLDGKIIAVLYAFARGGRLFGYLGGFDLAFARFSPGKALLVHAIGEAMRQGLIRFDFLRGTEDYKYAWGARNDLKFCLKLEHARPHRRYE